MSLKERICEELTSSVTGKMSRISLKKAIYAKGINQKSRSAFNAAIDQLCESGTISKIGGHSVCLQTMSGNAMGIQITINSSHYFNDVAQNGRQSVVTAEDKINPYLESTYGSEVKKFGVISFDSFNTFFEQHKASLLQKADVLNWEVLSSYKTTLLNSQNMVNCLKSGRLVQFPTVRGHDPIILIESKIHFFWIVDAILHDTPLSKTNTNYGMYRKILDKDMLNSKMLTSEERYALIALGTFLAHAHDFCNLISFAGIILLACLEQDGNKIIQDYCEKYKEKFQNFNNVNVCDKKNDDKFCNKHIVLKYMQYVLGQMTSVMKKEKTIWEGQPQIDHDVKPWMLNDRVIYVWNKINEYFAEKNKPREEAEMQSLIEMFTLKSSND